MRTRTSYGLHVEELQKPIHALNEQTMALLVHLAESRRTAPAGFVLPRRLQEGLEGLDAAAQARAAQNTVLLVDLHFADPEWWCQVHRGNPPACAEHKRLEPAVRARLVALTRSTVTLAWHMARAERDLSKVFLGMSDLVAETLSQFSPQELQTIAERHAGQLRLRWTDRGPFWSHLIEVARDGSPLKIRSLRIYALQLIGGALLNQRPH